jgi:hypothetical protein
MTKRKSYPTKAHTRILEAASRRTGLLALPLPGGLNGAVSRTVVDKLLELGWLEEVPVNLRRKEPLWRETRAQGGLTLVATEAGLAAIGIDPLVCRTVSRARRKGALTVVDSSSKPIRIRGGTKQARLVEMLRRGEGASLPEICLATGWQAHSARGAISGTLRKKLGLQVEAVTEPERGRVYRIGS